MATLEIPRSVKLSERIVYIKRPQLGVREHIGAFLRTFGALFKDIRCSRRVSKEMVSSTIAQGSH